MRKVQKYLFCLIISLTASAILPAQEALKSVQEEYYDFLALQGFTERPTLNYRTLSDSRWNIDEAAEHPWKGQNLGIFHHLFGDFRFRAYGPELFMSVNTAAPYGQNDGVLWQGRGFNAILKGGIRFEGYGVELTLMPHFAFSQNADFDIMPSSYDSEYGYIWGYSRNVGADAPQRFGNKPFFDWDFGDSEIRYTWKTLTVGFGTQAIWLGPSYLNSILHSNNAPAYPKFDIGLRKQRVTIPWINWYAGDVEARVWIGRLSESDYFDTNDVNNYTMFHGLSFSYAPSFLPGLTLFVNRVCLVPWEWKNLKFILPISANTIEDQKMSFGFSWIFPQVGFEVYGELGKDDYWHYVTFFHAMVYTVGAKKTIPILPVKKIYGEITAEWNTMRMSLDSQLSWPYSFYFHHQIIHGYTNRGQWLGAGSGWGGSSIYAELKVYYPKGSTLLFLHNNFPDEDFIYREAVYAVATPEFKEKYAISFKMNLSCGIITEYFLMKNFIIGGGFIFTHIKNPYYYYKLNEEIYNFSIQLTAKLLF